MVLTLRFEEFYSRLETTLWQCIQTLADQRVDDPTLTKVTEIVQTNFGPLCGAENTLNVCLVADKPDWRRNALETAYRSALLKTAEDSMDVSADFQTKYNILDMVLVSSELGYLDEVVPLALTEELLDSHTVAGCEKLFAYVENRKERLTANMVPDKGKSLVLLRMCNEMLRRLSKETNTVFCGRILMFLANSFPLSERSGVNRKGEFNIHPVLHDNYAEVDSDPSLSAEQKSFYKLFWETRKFYADPPHILQGENFTQFQKGIDAVLEKFSKDSPGSSNERTNSSTEPNEKIGSRRRRAELDADEKKDLAEQMLKEINQEFRFPRLLSSRNLLDLQMQDVRFQRNIILQTLVLLQYLSGFTHDEQEHTRELLAARDKKQTLVQPAFTVNQEQSEWLSITYEKLLNLLRSTMERGELYVDLVLTLLRHERNWIIWKSAGCPPFEKSHADITSLNQAINTKRRKLNPSLEKYKFKYGTKVITELYSRKQVHVMSTKPELPMAKQVLEQAVQRLEEDMKMTPSERTTVTNAALFRASRLLLPNQANVIPQIYALKKDIRKTINEAPERKLEPARDQTEANVNMKEKENEEDSNAMKVDQASEEVVDENIQLLRAAQKLIK